MSNGGYLRPSVGRWVTGMILGVITVAFVLYLVASLPYLQYASAGLVAIVPDQLGLIKKVTVDDVVRVVVAREVDLHLLRPGSYRSTHLPCCPPRIASS